MRSAAARRGGGERRGTDPEIDAQEALRGARGAFFHKTRLGTSPIGDMQSARGGAAVSAGVKY
jgi:hypothetical protein